MVQLFFVKLCICIFNSVSLQRIVYPWWKLKCTNCEVQGNIHTYPMEGHWEFWGMKLKWNFQTSGGFPAKQHSLGGMDHISSNNTLLIWIILLLQLSPCSLCLIASWIITIPPLVSTISDTKPCAYIIMFTFSSQLTIGFWVEFCKVGIIGLLHICRELFQAVTTYHEQDLEKLEDL